MHYFSYLSLFAGIGGFECGFKQAFADHAADPQGVTKQAHISSPRDRPLPNRRLEPAHCVGFSEIDPCAERIYRTHFPHHPALGDVTRIDAQSLPDFDLLCGGFPCQSFSINGKRHGLDDPRGALFFDIARIAKIKQPRFLFLENVKGFLSDTGGQTAQYCFATLDELGYDCQWQVLNSKDFGLPQNRERVFIVGHHRSQARPEIFPFLRKAQRPTATDQIVRLDRRQLHHLRRLTPLEYERLQGFPDDWTRNTSDHARYRCLANAVNPHLVAAITKRLFV
jgi:DNA (cytosine-5)-methyltransferase 1